jgi:hypothetical protein
LIKQWKCIPNNYLNFLKNKNENIEKEAKSRNKMKLLNNLKLTDIKGNIINAPYVLNSFYITF